MAAAGTVAAIMAAGASAAIGSGRELLGAAFVLVALLALAVTFAGVAPVLHRLPVVGATPPPDLRFHLEGEPGGMSFDMGARPADVILCAGVVGEGRREEITRVLLNAYVVGATDITRCHQDGSPNPSGGRSMDGPDARYWSESGLTIPLGSYLFFFRVTIPEPGEYEVVASLQSPDFHDKRGQFYRDTLTAHAATAET